jgi:hypothetical protein
VPVGSEVEVIRQDGGVVRGTLAERDERTVKVGVGSAGRSVPRNQIAEVRVVDAAKPTPLPPIARFREFTLPEGTKLAVRLDSAVGSDTSRVEDPVEATLSHAVVVDGVDVFPAGSVVKGRASLALRFTSVSVAGRDERSAIMARTAMQAQATKGEDAAKIGIPAAGGSDHRRHHRRKERRRHWDRRRRRWRCSRCIVDLRRRDPVGARRSADALPRPGSGGPSSYY